MKKYKTIFNYKKRILNIIIIIILGTFNKNYAQPINTNDTKINNIAPNYKDLKYWAAHPWKKDNSDSIPSALKNSIFLDSSVDVFFIHPTTYTNKNFSHWNADINNDTLNEETDNTTILYQASVFNESCRIFAPRYRQAHINAFYIDPNDSKKYFDIAYEDIKNAFEHYLEHYNNGRPIIIASHSQGTKHAGRLLKEYFEDKPLYNKLVCAYIIGMPIPDNYFKSIPVCDNPNQTGCFVGWRTFKSGYNPPFVEKEKFKSVVVNPLTWKTNDTVATKKLNKGGVLKNFNKIVPGVVDAQIHNNILWACKPDVFGKIFFNKKNFHIGDINLYYVNIRENVKTRISSYWKK